MTPDNHFLLVVNLVTSYCRFSGFEFNIATGIGQYLKKNLSFRFFCFE